MPRQAAWCRSGPISPRSNGGGEGHLALERCGDLGDLINEIFERALHHDLNVRGRARENVRSPLRAVIELQNSGAFQVFGADYLIWA
jgi:hypothetical protein